MKKILVTGGSGLLGSNFLQMLKADNTVVGIYNQHQVDLVGVEWHQLDLRDDVAVVALIKSICPDLIIHCAALTNVDFCEQFPDKARVFHVDVSRVIAKAAQEQGCQFVYISTDAVYGDGGMCTESDELAPVNEYARTKSLAEQVVLKVNPESLVIRTAIYGWNIQDKCSFSESVVKDLLFNRVATLFQDVFFSPILVNHLVEIIIELLAKGAHGVYNVGSPVGLSKLEFGTVLADIAGLETKNIVPIELAGKKLAAQRPLNPTMSMEKVQAFLGHSMPTVEYGLTCFMELLTSGYVEQFKPGVKTLQQLKEVWQ